MKGASLGQALALPTKVRLSWKGLPRANTLAYYKQSLITDLKCFITLGRGGKDLNPDLTALAFIN